MVSDLFTRRQLTAFFGGVFIAWLLFFSYGWVSTVVSAETAALQPNATNVTGGLAVGCAGANHTCLDDGVTNPTAPDTGTDYVEFGINNSDRYALETVPSVQTVTEVTVNLFHVSLSNNLEFQVSLFNGNGAVQYGVTQTVPIRSSGQWDTVTFSGLSLTQAELDDLNLQLNCNGAGGGQKAECLAYASYVDITYDPVIDVTVGSVGTQQNLDVGVPDQYVGGAFTFTENVASSNITSIDISETGTIDAANEVSNVRLFYDLDTTTPYDCVSETYDGTELQFGSTVTGGFSGADGSISVTDSVNITPTQTLCAYVVLDVASTSDTNETLELEIANPQTDVGFSSTFIEPDTPVTLAGTSVLQKVSLQQVGFHWRADDGTEATASSLTGGVEDTNLSAVSRGEILRLRTAVTNAGNQTSDGVQYRLEYAERVSTCADVSAWSVVGDIGSGTAWEMASTTNLTDGDDTTNIAVSTGGITDPNTTFLTPNGGVRESTNLTDPIVLTATEFVELEFALHPTANATEGADYCFRYSDAGTTLDAYSEYPRATILVDVSVDSIGSQVNTVDIPTSDVYAGGAITVTDQTPGAHNHDISSVTVAANGTSDIDNDIENVRLFYDLDTTAPYTCASESYSGTELQYGSTASGFANGSATFTDSVIIDTESTLCLYVVYDVASTTTDGGTVEFLIDNPSTDVVSTGDDVGPSATVEISGTTTFIDDLATQSGYHWRNDDGSETGASSATGGQANTKLEQLRIDAPARLRLGVANPGGKATPAYQYRLEWVRKISTCSGATGWTDVGAAGGDWSLFDSINLTNGADTTNIAVGDGGVPDSAASFVTPNGGVRDTTSQTGDITLGADSFTELEYSISATSEAVQGGTYCFRVTNAGTPIETYDEYPEVSIKEATDFLVQRGSFDMGGTSFTLTAGTDYVAPANATGAFIRITNTLNTGAGGGTTGNADDVTVYVSNPANITSGVTFTRPAGATGNTRVAWEIIEYTGAPGGQNEIIVRDQATVTYGTAATTVTTPTVSGVVNDARVAVFVTGQLNPDTATNYQYGNSTAAWNAGTDTATFTRGTSNNAAGLSYAVVEFTGSNWRVQRAEHTYTAGGTAETENITAVNSLSRAFVHSQKRMGANQNTHGDFGHQVWLSGIGQVSFALDSTVTTPASHTSVAWVIENVQTAGNRMRVTRSNGTQAGGALPLTANVNIGTTLEDLEIASIFINNSGTETGGQAADSFPEPMISAEITSLTQYQLYIADTDDSRSYRTEVVEWPTAARTFAQNYYRFYTNVDALTPTDPWPAGAADIPENSALTLADQPVAEGDIVRLRMSVEINAAGQTPGVDAYRLQYAERVTTCGAVSGWNDVGDPGTAVEWRMGDNPSVTGGTALSVDPPDPGDLLLSVADVAGTYEESDTSAFTPYAADPGEDVEFDWVLEHNGAQEKTEYCFRMIESNGLELLEYNFYPRLLTAAYEPVVVDWRWYEDEQSLTPTQPVASAQVTPSELENAQQYALRVALEETAGAVGENVKFALQYSEYADFSQGVQTLTATSSCAEDSLWCYAEGGGVNNTVIDETVLTAADSCTAGVGLGCGTYNTSTSTAGLAFTQSAFATTEYEFTLQHAGARANAVYYFRLYDLTNDLPVTASSSPPSANTQGAQLVFTVNGLASGTSTAGVVTTDSTTANSVSFAGIGIEESAFAAHRLSVDTNATEGYQVLLYTDQPLTNTYGDTIPAIVSTNAAPAGWSTGCDLLSQTGCFGYHTTDATLASGSTRFSALDTYAALDVIPREVMYSPVPANESHDIVYQVEVSTQQPAGNYETGIVFIAIPVF